MQNETRNKKQLLESIKVLLKGPTPKARLLANYLGAQGHPLRKQDEQSSLEFWGHPVPRVRIVAKDLELSWSEARLLWSASQIFEVRSIALYSLVHLFREEPSKNRLQDLLKISGQIDNWVHSDTLSDIFADYLENNPGFLSVLKKWNRSSNPWLRRLSIVSIYYYARFRKKKVKASLALKMIENLIEDSHFFVQRGVGWSLREVDRVSPQQQRSFVKKNLMKISSVAWFATSELYSEKQRRSLVLLRKKNRKGDI